MELLVSGSVYFFLINPRGWHCANGSSALREFPWVATWFPSFCMLWWCLGIPVIDYGPVVLGSVQTQHKRQPLPCGIDSLSSVLVSLLLCVGYCAPVSCCTQLCISVRFDPASAVEQSARLTDIGTWVRCSLDKTESLLLGSSRDLI